MFLKTCVYQAKEAIKEAERCDPDSIFTQFSIYKVAVLENNVKKGTCQTLHVMHMKKSLHGSNVAF